MQEIKFTSLTNCQQKRKVLHYGTLFQVSNAIIIIVIPQLHYNYVPICIIQLYLLNSF